MHARMRGESAEKLVFSSILFSLKLMMLETEREAKRVRCDDDV